MKILLLAYITIISQQSFAGLDLVVRKGLQFPRENRCGYDDCSEFAGAIRFDAKNLRCILVPNGNVDGMKENFAMTKTITVTLPAFQSTEDVSYQRKCIEKVRDRCIKHEVTSIIRQGFKFGDHYSYPFWVECLDIRKDAELPAFDEESASKILINLKNPFIQFE